MSSVCTMLVGSGVRLDPRSDEETFGTHQHVMVVTHNTATSNAILEHTGDPDLCPGIRITVQALDDNDTRIFDECLPPGKEACWVRRLVELHAEKRQQEDHMLQRVAEHEHLTRHQLQRLANRPLIV